MKVSELVAEISEFAEGRFGRTNHLHDCISVGMYPAETGWQVFLERPTQAQLDRGEMENFSSVRVFESKISFYSECHPSLVDALLHLRDRLENAYDWEDGNFNPDDEDGCAEIFS